MSSNVYRTAAEAVRRGWARGVWRSEQGGVCTAQALLDALGYKRRRWLPEAIAREVVLAILARDPAISYFPERRGRFRWSRQRARHLTRCITAWNDWGPRKKCEVVGLLQSLAEKHECRLSAAELAEMADREQRDQIEAELAVSWDELQREPVS